jgi:hypothetical protein
MDRHVAAGEVQPVVPSTPLHQGYLLFLLNSGTLVSAPMATTGSVNWLIDWQGDKSDF